MIFKQLPSCLFLFLLHQIASCATTSNDYGEEQVDTDMGQGELDCRGISGGNAALDNCGNCDENPANDCTKDCAGRWGGRAELDACGTCDEDPTNDCTPDCLGVWGGEAQVDPCGICDKNPANDCVQDCAGVWGGSATTDNCGTCDENPVNDCPVDCQGIWGGTAQKDFCGTCDDDPSNDCSKIYVSTERGSVLVINSSTGEILETIELNSTGLRDMATHPMLDKIYLADTGGDRVVVIDANLSRVGFITVGKEPRTPVFNADGSRLYVTNYQSDSISIVDTNTDMLVDTIPQITGLKDYPDTAAFNSVTGKLYVACLNESVVVIDTVTGSVVHTIKGFQFPYAIAVNNATNKIYVANRTGHSVSVIDGATDQLLSGSGYPITVDEPWGLAIDELENRVYVASRVEGAPSVQVLDGESDTLKSSIPLHHPASRIVFHPQSKNIYVTFRSQNRIGVIDSVQNREKTAIALEKDARPWAMVLYHR